MANFLLERLEKENKQMEEWRKETLEKRKNHNFITDEDNKEYVDLGLPSGTLWAKEDIFEIREDDGHRLYYVESYDNAIKKFGDRLPSKEQWEELFNECDWEYFNNDTILTYHTGYNITGKNGNQIVLEIGGRFNVPLGCICQTGVEGFYWSKDRKDEDNAYRLNMFEKHVCPDSYGPIEDFGWVRLVKNKI